MRHMPLSLPRWSVLVVLACLIGAVPSARADVGAPASAPSGTNLLANPGFEDALAGHPWMPAGWDTSRAGSETVFFGRDGFSAHSGSFGVSVANASTTLPLWHNWSQTLDVTPDMWGKDVVFTVWTKNNGVDGRGYVLLQAFRDTIGKVQRQFKLQDRASAAYKAGLPGVNDPITDLAWKRTAFSERETDWVQRTLRAYVAPSTNIVTVRMGLFGTGQVLFDDASLTLVDAQPAVVPTLRTNLLQDPGFEGKALGWEISAPPFAGTIAQLDTTVAHTGRSSMHMSCEAGLVSARLGVSQVISNRALSGKRLRAKTWVKTKNLGASVVVSLFFHTSTNFVRYHSATNAYGTMDWTPLVVEADVPPETYEIWALVEYTGPVDGHAWFDDASLEVLGPATGAPTPGLVIAPKHPIKAAGGTGGTRNTEAAR